MNILVNGIGGYMGKEVVKALQKGQHTLVGGIDIAPVDAGVPCADSFEKAKALFPAGAADCLIDFSHHSCTAQLLDFCVEAKLPAVIATTGHTEQELSEIEAAAKKIPVFHSANMSVGVALLLKLAVEAAKAMPEAEIEIVEKHHNRKVDAPSGTAMMLYRALQTVRKNATAHLGRSGSGKRTKDEIGIHAIRMGNLVGEHEVIIGTASQSITLKHEAYDRALFADGAVTAAEFLIKMPAGLYDMHDLLKG